MSNGKKMIEMFPDESRKTRAKAKWRKMSKGDSVRIKLIIASAILNGIVIVAGFMYGWTKADNSIYFGIALLIACSVVFAMDIWGFIVGIIKKLK